MRCSRQLSAGFLGTAVMAALPEIARSIEATAKARGIPRRRGISRRRAYSRILEACHPAALTACVNCSGLAGLAECAWLDVKGEVYVLDRPHGAEELLKDVAAFANAQGGGILLVGLTTRKENDQEVIDQVRPVPRAVSSGFPPSSPRTRASGPSTSTT